MASTLAFGFIFIPNSVNTFEKLEGGNCLWLYFKDDKTETERRQEPFLGVSYAQGCETSLLFINNNFLHLSPTIPPPYPVSLPHCCFTFSFLITGHSCISASFYVAGPQPYTSLFQPLPMFLYTVTARQSPTCQTEELISHPELKHHFFPE